MLTAMILREQDQPERQIGPTPEQPDPAPTRSQRQRGPGRPRDTRPVLPLSDDEAALLDRALRRVHERLQGFIAAMPPHAEHASGMARFLEVERTTCQRAVSAVDGPFPGIDLIDRLPGSRGIEMLARSARRRLPKAQHESVDALAAAAQFYDSTVRKLAGSQSRLIRRLRTSSQPARAGLDERAHLDSRRKLFEASAAITGRWSNTWVAAYMYRPHEHDGNLLHHARVNGLLGHEWRADAVPLTFHSFNNRRMHERDGAPEHEQVGVFEPLFQRLEPPFHLLDEFSTRPAPIVASRQTDEFMVQAIDAISDSTASWRPVDLVFGSRSLMNNPAKMRPRIEECWALINLPVRAMLFDVFLHKDLARRCIPQLDAHLWRPDFASGVGDRWQTRLSHAPTLSLLGRGFDRVDDSWSPRHRDLLGAMFDAENADPTEFIGFRCATEFPLWRCGYCMSFDFGARDDGDAS